MFLDWVLASFHHLAVFSLAGILAAELVADGGRHRRPRGLRLARIDAWFGIMAAIALAAGLLRIFLAAKGLDYYMNNAFFWVKMSAVRRPSARSRSRRPMLSSSGGDARGPAWARLPAAGARDLAGPQGALCRGALVRPDPALRRRDGAGIRLILNADEPFARRGDSR